MDYVEDDDFAEGVYGEDFGGHDDLNAGRRGGERHPRGLAGPSDVTFSVFVDPAPAEGEVVVLKGNLDELRDGVPCRPCETGNGRLWTVTVQLNITGAAAAAAPGPMGAGLFGVLGGLGSLGVRAAPPPLFEVTYAIRNAAGVQTQLEDKPTPEQGPLRQYYYHRAKFALTTDKSQDEAFPLFVHDEVHLLQSGATTSREFLSRFLQLAAAPFARKRSLLDKALEELILVHWGENAVPPNHVVLAIAATLGYFRRQASHGPAFAPLYDEHSEMALGYAHGGLQPGGSQDKKEEPPPSLVVCRWIVKHCPARSDVAEDEERHTRGRDRDGHLGGHQLQRYTQMGVLQADDPDVDGYFGNLSSALFSHFCVITLEGWPDIAQTAMRHSPWWALYFVGMIIFTNFALVNLMVGVIVQRIIFLSREQETELASFTAESEQFRSTLQTLFDTVDLKTHHHVTREEIRSLLRRPETHEIMAAFGINLNIPEATLHAVMDLNREGATTFQEFFDACIRLCGSQQSVHSVFVQADICKCRHDLEKRMRRIEHLAHRLGPEKRGRASRERPRAAGGAEAAARELLERLEPLARSQRRLLADVAALRERAARGGLAGPAPALPPLPPPAPGGSPGPQSSRLGGLGLSSRSSASSPFRADSPGPLDAHPTGEGRAVGRGAGGGHGGTANRRTQPAGEAQPLQQLLERTGQELGPCCSLDPMFPFTASSPGARPRSAEPAPRRAPNLRAEKRRGLEEEFQSRRDVAALRPH